MSNKKTTKKLGLNKTTVKHLSAAALQRAGGGTFFTSLCIIGGIKGEPGGGVTQYCWLTGTI